MTFLMCLVMLQYMCHAKSACNNRHPKLCILHPGKRGFLTNDKTVNQAVDFDRTEFTQPKWLQDEFAKSAELENLFGDMEDDQEEEEDDFIPFNDDRFDYTQGWLNIKINKSIIIHSKHNVTESLLAYIMKLYHAFLPLPYVFSVFLEGVGGGHQCFQSSRYN